MKLSLGGGSAGQKGVQSVYDYGLGIGLNSKNIWRLKIGIRPTGNKQKSETFVLKKAGQGELNSYVEIANKLEKLKSAFANKDFAKLQNVLNTR